MRNERTIGSYNGIPFKKQNGSKTKKCSLIAPDGTLIKSFDSQRDLCDYTGLHKTHVSTLISEGGATSTGFRVRRGTK